MGATLEQWRWLAGDDHGISSETIWSVMTGEAIPRGWWRHGRPLDPDDFGRCFRLLLLFPEWRARLPEVAARYPAWTELVERWADVERAFVAEVPCGRHGRAPATGALMEEIASLRCCCGTVRLGAERIAGWHHTRNGCYPEEKPR